MPKIIQNIYNNASPEEEINGSFSYKKNNLNNSLDNMGKYIIQKIIISRIKLNLKVWVVDQEKIKFHVFLINKV